MTSGAKGGDSMAEAKKKNAERECRIVEEIIVDAYGPEERATGWYYYLEEKLGSPFPATCIVERAVSPLRAGGKVEVVDMASEQGCEHEMFIAILGDGPRLAGGSLGR